ncbi:MAG: hypothetical protein E7404_05445 [Ruminococcaceae bacterium]|nr:hypothetical protein [Oscillospiraceae bacterium]
MANDIGNKINEILNNPDAMGKISDMMSGMKNNQNQNSIPDADMMEKVSRIASKMSDKSDPKINLLYALRPYMNNTRSQHIDRAIKMIQLTKITELFKDL